LLGTGDRGEAGAVEVGRVVRVQAQTARRAVPQDRRGHKWPRLSCGIMCWAGTLATIGGRLVHKENAVGGTGITEINSSGWLTGLYVMELTSAATEPQRIRFNVVR
jgi:hypothetical protein